MDASGMSGERFPLELRDLTTGYGDVAVVRHASMRFAERLITTIIGSNGAGKSTVIKAAAGLLPAWQGSVHADGTDITREPAWRRVGRGIAYVPQGRVVVPEMTVADNLEIGAHILKGDRQKIRAATERVTQLFPVLAQRLKQLAGTMSGGEQQMLAIGRGLMGEPRLLILDEPSLGLSPLLVEELFALIAQLHAQGLAILLVEQNVAQSLEIAQRAYVLENGAIQFSGTGEELLASDRLRLAYLGV